MLLSPIFLGSLHCRELLGMPPAALLGLGLLGPLVPCLELVVRRHFLLTRSPVSGSSLYRYHAYLVLYSTEYPRTLRRRRRRPFGALQWWHSALGCSGPVPARSVRLVTTRRSHTALVSIFDHSCRGSASTRRSAALVCSRCLADSVPALAMCLLSVRAPAHRGQSAARKTSVAKSSRLLRPRAAASPQWLPPVARPLGRRHRRRMIHCSP